MEDPRQLLETDQNGNIVTKPVTGWITGTVADIDVILAIQYAQSPLELQTGRNKSIQFVLKPQQCLELSEKLKTLANRLLENRS